MPDRFGVAGPCVFAKTDAIPRLADGKPDADELLRLVQQDKQAASRYIAPRNAEEELLAGIWADILGIFKLQYRGLEQQLHRRGHPRRTNARVDGFSRGGDTRPASR
ncbi:MAG: hypothetical protein GY862_33425 [Gammaproteobacteria bacterium]|nr:hypothetical protein [Gammaproteobacteria bacterium]